MSHSVLRMEYNNDGPTDDDIREAVLVLSADGKILGKCPGCKLPLHHHEMLNNNCDKCGEIDFMQIVFVKNSDQLN